MSAYLKVSEISCTGLPAIGRFTKHVGTFYLFVTIDEQVQWTSSVKQSNPKWEDKLCFDTTMMDDGLLSVQVYAMRSIGEDDLVGELNTSMNVLDLLSNLNENGQKVREPLYKKDKNEQEQQTGGIIEFTLLRANADLTDRLNPTNATNIVNATNMHKKTVTFAGMLVSGANIGMKKVQGTYNIWKPLLQNIDAFVKIVDGVSDVHSYARMVWSVLSLPLKAILAQNQRDKKIQNLLEAMNDIYSAVLKAGPLKLAETHRKTIQLMCQQTAECAFFISDYSSRSFGGRMVKSTTTGYSSKADGYIQKFKQLKKDFRLDAAVVTEITVHQIASKTDEILKEAHDISLVVHLNDMHYAKSLYKPDGCLPGTRENVIRAIMRWFSRPIDDGQRVFWLSGVAGCGKSTIARSVADQLGAQRRCVSFFFNASRQSEAGPDRLFATISQNMTELSVSWKASLIHLLKESISVRKCATIQEQFENFILRPAEKVEATGSILIVIDALDECGTVQQRIRLLEILGNLKNLPLQFRFLITSRPETDIIYAFNQKPWVHHYRLHDSNPELTDLDIERYVRKSLLDTPALDKTNIEAWAREIVMRSERLFQWAATACKYIRGQGEIGDDPMERVAEVMKLPAFNGLDALYTTVLDRLAKFQQGDITYQRFQTIMGRVLALRESMSIDELSNLWYDEEDRDQVRKILGPLGSLLSGVSQRDEAVQPIHLSFADYLTTQARSGKYWIDVEKQEEKLMSALFREMRGLLRFNICNLITSYECNSEVKDLDARITLNIPTHLNYACRRWVDHLSRLPITREWVNKVDDLMRSCLLFWFEALSLMGKMDVGLNQLIKLRSWLGSLENVDRLQLLVQDAYRFGSAFGHIMQYSTPHLYLSALPFIPRSSPVSEAYLQQYLGCADIIDKHKISWPQVSLSMNVTSPVYAIAYSPDGKRVASGSDDKAVRIWDTDTGELVAGPFQGHTYVVTSVGFSPNGKRVVSGSRDNTVRIWDADTGELVAGPFQGHADVVTSVGFSPDGKRVVSGSFDNTVRIWNADTGELVAGPFQGHTSVVTSVGFSPDGKQVVSGSFDKTVRIWNANTGKLVTGPFQGHTDVVTSVGFSPNGKRVVSGSGDNTVRIWNANTGELAADPFQGHTYVVTSVGFSPDGKRVVSGSFDNTVRIWNANTGELVAGPFQGHTDIVTSVGFSPDGKQVVSGSEDNTVRTWNADTGKLQVIAGPFQGHTDVVTSVGLSPNGKRVVSGSRDNTVRIWNADTGELVAGPFQGHADVVTSVGFSPDGKRVVSGSRDNTVRIWNVDTGELVANPFQGHTNWVRSVGFSPDGEQVVSSSHDNTVRIWNANTGELAAGPFQGHTDVVTSVGFSPDGKQVVSGSGDNTVRIWSANTGELVAGPFHGHTDWVRSVGFSPDGKRVVSASYDKTVRIWNADTGELVAGPFHGHTNWVRSVGFSPDGKRVVSGSHDNTVRIWNADTGELAAGPFQGHTDVVTSVGFLPDGKRVVSSSGDNTVRIWNANTGELVVAPFQGHTNIATSVGFSLDGKQVASGLRDNTARIWSLQDFSSVSSILFGPGFHYENGWIFSGGTKKKRLFWTPEQFYPHVQVATQVVLMANNPFRVDITNLSHGENWTQCYQP